MQQDFMNAQWWRDQQARRDESRLDRAAEPWVSVTVQAGNPVQWGGIIYQPGQTFTLPKYLADNLVLGGRVVINP